VREAIDAKIDPLVVLNKLNAAIGTVGEKFGRGDVFTTDLVGSAEAMKVGVQIIEPLILKNRKQVETLGKIAMVTAEGELRGNGPRCGRADRKDRGDCSKGKTTSGRGISAFNNNGRGSRKADKETWRTRD
jgi:hypothetical protein